MSRPHRIKAELEAARRRRKPLPKMFVLDRVQDVADYDLLHDLISRNHTRLVNARIVLVLCTGWPADKDGKRTWGKCVKVPELYQRLCDLDFVIQLDAVVWCSGRENWQRALLDHELCHAEQVLDQSLEQRETPDGIKLWRLRKHDVEEFTAVVGRYGAWKSDLDAFFEAKRARDAAPLFVVADDDDLDDDLQAALVATEEARDEAATAQGAGS